VGPQNTEANTRPIPQIFKRFTPFHFSALRQLKIADQAISPVENGCGGGRTLPDCGMVKVARKIRLEGEGNDAAYWLSRPPLVRLRALDGMRRMYIKAYVAPGK
jgi:hypothetical protein